MNMAILSLIIPVYNVEKYINKCILSCLNQEVVDLGHDYEIIIINDESPDKSIEIARELTNTYNGVTIIDQNNQGLSIARNNGISIAKGEYVWFVDSDDWIVENCLKDIVEKLNKFQPDIMHLNHNEIWDETNEIKAIVSSSQDSYTTAISGKEDLMQLHFPIPAQLSIYRRQFLLDNNLFFTPKILHEDMEFTPRAVYLAEKVIWHKPIVYNFLKNRNGSITSRFSLKNFYGYKAVMESIHEFTNKEIKESLCIEAMYRVIGLAMNTLLHGIHKLPKEDFKKAITQIKTFDPYFKDMTNSKYFKYIIEGFLFKINKKLALDIFNFIKKT